MSRPIEGVGEAAADDSGKSRGLSAEALLGLENLCATPLLDVRVFFSPLQLRAEDERSKETRESPM